MVHLDDIQRAHAILAGRIHRTPVFSSRALGEVTGTTLYLKAECLQKTGSFKVRGVFNRIEALSSEARARGLVTISAGNHAQALAYGASAMGVRCTVVMPAHASPTKVEASRSYGADVVLHGDVFAAFERMEELQREHGYTLVHPFDDEGIIAGQGTVGLELIADLDDLHAVIVPVGGGGLISGIATAVKTLRPEVKVIGVEPEGAPGLRRALDEGHVVRLERVNTIADGLGAPSTGEIVLEHVRAYVDDVVLVTDDDIKTALAAILARAKLLVEPAGAAGVAALMARKVRLSEGSRVAVIASGGNIDLERLKEVLP
ncbi:MAG: threonine ammonia-lyase [Longimicrobiales bacterium]